MTKTHRTEIIEEYDENGKLVRKTTTEETEESNDPTPTWGDNWWTQWGDNWWTQQPTIRYNKYADTGDRTVLNEPYTTTTNTQG